MIKFRVDVHGKHFRVQLIKKRWLRREQLSSKLVGFYTTRFVEAANANEAIDKVFEKLRTELANDGRATEDSILELNEICEDDSGFDLYSPGGGYTFYTEEDGSMLD